MKTQTYPSPTFTPGKMTQFLMSQSCPIRTFAPMTFLKRDVPVLQYTCLPVRLSLIVAILGEDGKVLLWLCVLFWRLLRGLLWLRCRLCRWSLGLGFRVCRLWSCF